MNRLVRSSLLILAAIMIFGVVGCHRESKLGIERIIAVEKDHATRISVTYKDKNGSYYKTSFHQSQTITDGTTTINPHDYLSGYGGKKSMVLYQTVSKNIKNT